MNDERTGSSVLERFLDPFPGHFLENDVWTPPPRPPSLINFVHGSCMLDMDMIAHMAAALGPLAGPSRNARPRKCLN